MVVVDRMTVDDLPGVEEIERESFTTPWPPHAYRSELETNKWAHYIVARYGDQLVGFAGISRHVARGWNGRPAHRGRAGSQQCAAGENAGRFKEVTPVIVKGFGRDLGRKDGYGFVSVFHIYLIVCYG